MEILLQGSVSYTFFMVESKTLSYKPSMIYTFFIVESKTLSYKPSHLCVYHTMAKMKIIEVGTLQP